MNEKKQGSSENQNIQPSCVPKDSGAYNRHKCSGIKPFIQTIR